MKVSIYSKAKDATSQQTIDFLDCLNGIKLGKWEDVVLNYRAGRTAKELIPGITPSGTFKHRRISGLIEHSGLLNVDIDAKDNNEFDLIQMREQIYADPYVYAGNISVGGKGITLYVKINGKKHYESFLSMEKYMANKYNLVIDRSCKDVSRLRFVSYDPEVYINEKSKKWIEYLPKEKQEPRVFNNYITSSDDFGFVMAQIRDRRLNIADDYADWLKIGFSLANEFGEAGRADFHNVSSNSPKYNPEQSDKKYNSILKSGATKTTISSFYFLAKQAGCEIKSDRTKKIESVGKMRYKQVGKSGGVQNKEDAKKEAKKYLLEVEKIEGKDVEEILDKIEVLPEQSLNEKTDVQTKIDTIIQMCKQRGIKFNTITQKLEQKTKELTDNDLNSIFIDILEIDEKMNRELFQTIIFSNRIEEFDPLVDFIERNKHLKPKGVVDQVLECLKDNMTINGVRSTGYKDVYVRKWMLSIIASIYGTYSLMILVLTGRQMIQKTNFFRELLPPELHKYYAESKLDAAKDDEILMTQKLIIVDDEFGGKSKQEAKKLKDLSSKQYFSIRKPYGRLVEDIRRIAVLGGTSNDDEILNDPTGNRRIIPLQVDNIDINSFRKIDKTELLIELYHEWCKIGDEWMLSPDEVDYLNNATLKHEQDVMEYDLIMKYYFVDNTYIDETTTTDIKVYLEERTGQRLNVYKIGQSLKKLGYIKKSIRKDSAVKQAWNVRKLFDMS